MTRPPVALTIAGSDPSGGAGIQADLKTFSALGVYGCAVLTALTAQNTRGVTGVHDVPAGFVTAQLETLVDDVRLDAVKLGMLSGAPTVVAVSAFLEAHPELPVVLDPVMVATSGDVLLEPDAVDAVRALLTRADLVTPNLPEAAVLLAGEVAADVPGMRRQATALRRLGARRVLLKGGHLAGPPVDVYADASGTTELAGVRVDTANTHGTGCTLSSAVAAHVAHGRDWMHAVRAAKDYVSAALVAGTDLAIGSGHGPVHHFYEQWPAQPNASDGAEPFSPRGG